MILHDIAIRKVRKTIGGGGCVYCTILHGVVVVFKWVARYYCWLGAWVGWCGYVRNFGPCVVVCPFCIRFIN
jgi:hypothetical protein